MTRRYIQSLISHKYQVINIGLKVGGLPLHRLVLHDMSKFSPAEYGPYTRRFSGRPYSKEEWDRAWLHHIHRNPHHWNHWLIEGKPIPMPETYVREMVVDWMAAERGYHGGTDISAWLNKSVPKMILHEKTIVTLEAMLKEVGFRLPGSE
ncbi:hypothetical protein JW711_03100 [Candidatus Woesearchaeota archaeon]|nr:hypothetical protein [Candidatus Woesearchaeota archaeon]